MRSELFENTVLVALIEQVQILRAQCRQKAVRIEKLPGLTVRESGAQLIPKNLGSFRDEAFEKTFIRHPIQLMNRLNVCIELDDRTAHRIAQKGPDDHTLASPALVGVHPEHPVGRRVSCA
jgi:hypothetical protein